MIHHVYANRSNAGDWLSARGIQSLLAPLQVQEYLCDDPFVGDTLRALRQVPEHDTIVVGGGGLLMDYFDPLWEGLAALPTGIAICLWGVGYCDLKYQPSHPRLAAVQDVIRRSALCVVRDEITRAHLRLPGLPDPVVCPSLCVIDPLPPGRGILHVDNYDTVGAAAFDAMDEMCRRHAQRSDRPYRRTNNRLESASESELNSCLQRYASSDVVVSSALHGCIVAVGMGRPVIAVSGDTKIDAFMGAAGLAEWVLDPPDVERLPQLLERLPDQRVGPGFVARARAQNADVARVVRNIVLARDRSGRSSP